MGEPTRIVIGGVGPIPGLGAAGKKQYLAENLDALRKFVINEPRGHRDMFGAIIVEPEISRADLGVVFMDGGGYLNMCGHGIMGTAVASLETGIITKEGVSYNNNGAVNLELETPAGLVGAEVEQGEIGWEKVTVSNVPSFVHSRDLTLTLASGKKIFFAIAFGGSFFALVDVVKSGLKLNKELLPDLSRIALELREKINRKFTICHPTLDYITEVDLVEFYQPLGENPCKYKNLVVFGQGQIDRSPCGTGTSAKMALLYEQGALEAGERVESTSIIGTKFTAEFNEELTVDNYRAIKPKITGRAYITGFNHLVLNPADPLPEGFVI